MRNIRNFNTISGAVAAIALLAAATIIVAEVAASKKSTYEQKIEAIMVEYVKAIQSIENSHDKKMAPVIKVARTIRDDAVAKTGQVVLARFERAAKDSKRLGRTSDAKLAEEKIAEFKKTSERAKTTDPDKPEVKDKGGVVVKAPPLTSHVMFGGHSYLAIMGECTFSQALVICKKLGGYLVCIESAQEMVFLQKELPVKYTLWAGASDARHKKEWYWLTGKAVNRACWSKDHPKDPSYHSGDRSWNHIHAALTDRGMVSLGYKSKCKGFICEWGR